RFAIGPAERLALPIKMLREKARLFDVEDEFIADHHADDRRPPGLIELESHGAGDEYQDKSKHSQHAPALQGHRAWRRVCRRMGGNRVRQWNVDAGAALGTFAIFPGQRVFGLESFAAT